MREVVAVPDTSDVFASVLLGNDHIVHKFHYDGSRLVDCGQVAAAGAKSDTRPLAAMRPILLGGAWHLVVGHFGKRTLSVLALPECRLVWEGMPPDLLHRSDSGIQGLAADPNGTALVVCLSNGFLEAVEWPWEGLGI